MSAYELDDYADVYWEQDARTDRDEFDLQLRAVEEEERDRVTRDSGEGAPHAAVS